MVYNYFVEIGRVAFIAKGKDEQKLAVIVDVVDNNKVLLDGPSSGVLRGIRNLKDLHLTKYKVPIRVGQHTKKVQVAYDEAKINEEWAKSSWAKKLQKEKIRAGLNDFERFKVKRVKQLRNRIIAKEFGRLRNGGQRDVEEEDEPEAEAEDEEFEDEEFEDEEFEDEAEAAEEEEFVEPEQEDGWFNEFEGVAGDDSGASSK